MRNRFGFSQWLLLAEALLPLLLAFVLNLLRPDLMAFYGASVAH